MIEARMAMHLERVGGRFVAAMAVLLAVAGNAAFAQEHKTYRCKVADVVTWGDDGLLRLDSNPRHWMRQRYDGVIIDALTGAVTHTDDQRELWNVVQRGDPRENDYVLIQQQTAQVPSDQIKARAATEFIRIRAWSEKPMPTVRLLAFHWGDFASGPCEVVR